MTKHALSASPQAFFTYAEAYAKSAQSLMDLRLALGHADAPIRLLWFHANELYLKAFLVCCGISAEQLSKPKLGHNFETLLTCAFDNSFSIEVQDRTLLIEAYQSKAIFQARYLEPDAPGKLMFELDLLQAIADRFRVALLAHPARRGKIIFAGEGNPAGE